VDAIAKNSTVAIVKLKEECRVRVKRLEDSAQETLKAQKALRVQHEKSLRKVGASHKAELKVVEEHARNQVEAKKRQEDLEEERALRDATLFHEQKEQKVQQQKDQMLKKLGLYIVKANASKLEAKEDAENLLAAANATVGHTTSLSGKNAELQKNYTELHKTLEEVQRATELQMVSTTEVSRASSAMRKNMKGLKSSALLLKDKIAQFQNSEVLQEISKAETLEKALLINKQMLSQQRQEAIKAEHVYEHNSKEAKDDAKEEKLKNMQAIADSNIEVPRIMEEIAQLQQKLIKAHNATIFAKRDLATYEKLLLDSKKPSQEKQL